MFDQKLGLNILRSPIYGDLRISDIDLDTDYDIIEQGITEGNIRIWFGSNDSIHNDAMHFNNQPIVLCEANHKGELKGCHSYFSYNCDSASVITVKYAEDSDDIIVRGVENNGQSQNINVLYNGDFVTGISPYEIFTLKICTDKCSKVNILEE